MRFRYKLQKIVDLKSNQKAQAEWMLSMAMSKMKLEEQSLEELEQTRRSLTNSMQEAALATTSAAELTMLQSYLQHIDMLIERKVQQLNLAKLEVAKRSDELVARMKDEKIWHKARERSLSAFRENYNRREQATLDEMASVRFGKP
jgi:flagellar FliJ protein